MMRVGMVGVNAHRYRNTDENAYMDTITWTRIEMTYSLYSSKTMEIL